MASIPQVSHLSCHMGCSGWDEEVGRLYDRLAKEYELEIRTSAFGVERFPEAITGETLQERIDSFIRGLKKLKPGSTYLFVEHPALESMEMEAVGHEGYYTVNTDRQMVTDMFTSPEVKKVIKEQGIELISYADLVENGRK
jgi:predicted glycoside hydrolase/deacetylase ChbG (UPF0249 family)